MCASKHALSRHSHVQQKKRWIFRALGPVVDLAPFFIETWRCDLCDDMFHRFDCVNASVETRGDNVRKESHRFDGHTQTKRRLGALKHGEIHRGVNGHISPNVNQHCLNTFNVIERMTPGRR